MFDGYRAFAILGIVLFHVLINSGVVQRAGGSFGGQLIWAGGPQLVDILFIVSGFVVYLPTVAQGGRFGSVSGYAIRRGARLLPAYWLSLVVMLLVMKTQPGVPTPNAGDLASNFGGQQTLVQMLCPDNQIGFGFDTPLWTLTLEIGFYIVLPFIAAPYFKRPLARASRSPSRSPSSGAWPSTTSGRSRIGSAPTSACDARFSCS